MELGQTLVLSTKTSDCGVCGFYDIDPNFKAGCISIGRIKCNPNVQLHNFSTVPDDMFILIPKEIKSIEFLFYISTLIKQESWRFNYSRKVTRKKLENLELSLPTKNNKIDKEYIKKIVNNSYGFETILSTESHLTQNNLKM